MKWTIVFPTTLTCLRIVAAVCIWVLVSMPMDPPLHRTIVRAVFSVAVVSDFFDGMAARRLHVLSRLGYILDPIADKLFFNTLFLYSAFFARSHFPVGVPAWLVWSFLVRDALWTVGVVVLKCRAGRVTVPPSLAGKAMNWVAAALVTAVLACPEWLSAAWAAAIVSPLGAVCVILAVISLIQYAVQSLYQHEPHRRNPRGVPRGKDDRPDRR